MVLYFPACAHAAEDDMLWGCANVFKQLFAFPLL